MNQKFFTLTVITALSFVSILLSQRATPLAQQPEVLSLAESAIYIPDTYKDIGIPEDLVVLSDNSYWYVDSMNYRINKVNTSGNIVRSVGKQGEDFGEFADVINSITKDNDGNLYVLSYCHVYKLDFNGGFMQSWGGCGVEEQEFSNALGIHYDPVNDIVYVSNTGHHNVLKFSKTGSFLGSFGSEGSGDGQLTNPVGINTDSSGRVYVVDSDNHRVQRFSSTGTFQLKFGSFGAGDGEFTFPKDIAIASNGNLYVSSQNSQKIQIFNSSGSWLSAWGQFGEQAWQFHVPRYLGFDSSGNLLVTDVYLRSIQKFTSAGEYIDALRNSGFVEEKFYTPHDAEYDSEGNLYILDNGPTNGRIQKFTNGGTHIATIVDGGEMGGATYHMSIKNDLIYVTHGGGFHVYNLSGESQLEVSAGGDGDGEFSQARGIAVDDDGFIYVADMYNGRIQKFDSAGNFVTKWGTVGTGNGEFGWPEDIYFDSTSDLLYVADNEGNDVYENTRVQVFTTAGVYQSTIGTWGYEDNQLDKIGGITKGADGNIHISDLNRHKIKVYTTAGAFQGTYGAEGSGVENFSEPARISLNPLTDTITIADQNNHRVQLLPGGTRIINLNASADVKKNDNSVSLVNNYINPLDPEADNIASYLFFGNYVVSDFSVDMTEDRDWDNVKVTTLVNESLSLVVDLDQTGAPGISTTHSLYIVKHPGQTSVRVCPTATQVHEVTLDCEDGYTLSEGDSTLSTVSIQGVDYWRVSGLTGTGIISEVLGSTPIPTSTVTTTSTSTPTPTVTVTTEVTTTATPTTTIGVTTLIPVPTLSELPACPVFEEFSVSSTIVEKGKAVTFSWKTRNTEIVKTDATPGGLPAIGTLDLTLSETAEVSFIADNGACNDKQQKLVQVVDTLPWNTTLSLGTGMLLVEALFALQQPTLFGNIWLALGGFLGKRKRQTWGIIYDAKTKKPLGRAVIRLQRVSDKSVIDTVVSDAAGTFKLTSKPGEYTVTVSLTGYTFPSTVVKGESDGGYSQIYRGEKITVTSAEEGILVSIPLDPANLSDAEKTRLRINTLLRSTFALLSNVLIFGGFSYSVYVAYLYPHPYNFGILAVYTLLALGKLVLQLPRKQYGVVRLSNGEPAVGIEVGLFDTEFKNLLYRTFTNEQGHYTFVVPNRSYNLKIMDSRYQLLEKGMPVSGIMVRPITQEEKVRVITTDLSVEG
ncbi:MAG: 6-bladed beta-propeller [Candidatus Dojkabacteria bacterium]|nr:MAG: 6-bladed beta-propeller [Candidatus Dojkabacteria bacterium]